MSEYFPVLYNFFSSSAFYPFLNIMIISTGLAFLFHYLHFYKKRIHLYFFLISVVFLIKELGFFFTFSIDLFPGGVRYPGYDTTLFFLVTFAVALSGFFFLKIHNLKSESSIFLTANLAAFVLFCSLFVLRGEFMVNSFFINFLRVQAAVSLAAVLLMIATQNMLESPEIELILINKPSLVMHLSALFLCVFFFFPHKEQGMLAALNHVSFPLTFIAYLLYFYYTQTILDNERIELEDRISDAEREKDTFVKLTDKIGKMIVKTQDSIKICQLITDSAKRSVNAESAILWEIQEDGKTFKTHVFNGLFPPLKPVKSFILERQDRLYNKVKNETFKFQEGYAGKVASTKKPFFVRDLSRTPHPDFVQTISEVNTIESVIAVPVLEDDKTVAVLAVANKEGNFKNFSEADLSMLETLADQVALAFTQVRLQKDSIAQKMAEQDVNTASDIQQGLLPQSFDTNDRIDFYGFSYAAKGVGGDFFFYKKFHDKKIGFVMSDVAGKGVPASLVMVIIRSTFVVSAQENSNPAEVVSVLNRILVESGSQERYATFIYYIFDAEKMEVTFCNAANQPILFYNKEKDLFDEPDTDGMPLGIMPEVDYQNKTFKVSPGDVLALYTDGITEAMNLKRDQYGMDRLKKAISSNSDKTAKEISDYIYNDIETFTEEAPQHDDETLFIQKIL